MQIAICDDEMNIRELISDKVLKQFPEAEVDFYSSGDELLLADKLIDILFLDIQMSGKNGMETARELRKKNKKTIIIFVTALEEYVFQAFDVGAFHYIVKPIEDKKFTEVLCNAVDELKALDTYTPAQEERYMMINNGGGGEFHFTFGNIIPDTIDDFVAAAHDSSAKAWIEAQGFAYMSASSEEELEKQLPQFVSGNSDKPLFFEVFTNRSIDGATIRKIFALNHQEVLAPQKPAEYKKVVADRRLSANYPQYPFPYDKVIGLGKKIVIYGAGNVGKIYYQQVSKNESCEVVAWIDKNAERIASSGIPVEGLTALKDRDYDAVVIAIKDSEVVKQVKATLLQAGVAESKIVWSIVEL